MTDPYGTHEDRNAEFVRIMQDLAAVGVTAAEQADLVGCTEGHLSYLKNGRRPVTKELMQRTREIVTAYYAERIEAVGFSKAPKVTLNRDLQANLAREMLTAAVRAGSPVGERREVSWPDGVYAGFVRFKGIFVLAANEDLNAKNDETTRQLHRRLMEHEVDAVLDIIYGRKQDPDEDPDHPDW